jgi:hypothetical protein
MNVATALITLNCTLPQLYALMSNPGFPTAVSNDGNGNIVFTDAQVIAFAALMASATSNGWTWSTAELPTANFQFMNANATGSFYRGSVEQFDPVDGAA